MSDLSDPIGLVAAGDGSGRLFIVEQEGMILAWKDGALQQKPFLDIRDRVGRHGSEQGLLGLAFHPDYANTGFFYVNYTDQKGDTHISRFSVSADNPDLADPGSEKLLIFVDQPFPNHNGGSVVFGPDGYLYLGLGDGGSGGDPFGNGQSTDTLLGKILRIDVNSGDPYGIPADNPFANGGGRPEIWAYGLRNPWRFTFDSQTGDIYIGDVGQDKWEEIDYLPAGSPPGANFGWNYREGRHRYQGVYLGNDLIEPVAEYDHGQGCSVTGGMVYRGSSLPEWQGVYLYGDYCSGRVWGLLKNPDGSFQNSVLFDTHANITSFGVDEAGEIYLVEYAGTISQLTQ
jgi:glucose/arabinose dehydrogenase